MESTVWSQLKQGMIRTSSSGGDGLRQVTLRLAAQTVGLLLVMLLVLEVVVYLITQQALLGSLENTLKARTIQPDPTVCRELQLPCAGQTSSGTLRGPSNPRREAPGQGGFPPPGSFGSGAFRADLTASDATSIYLNAHLHAIHADGVLGLILLDPAAARRALSTKQAQCCSVGHYQDEKYLVYTSPIVADGRVAGVVQASISEHQYDNTMEALRNALLVVAVLGLLVSAGISALLVQRALTPIRIAVQRQRDFVADAAHELRTPLAIQRTVGEVGLADDTAGNHEATVEQMLAENKHLTRLVDDLSLLARADSHAVSITPARMNLSSLVQDTTSELEPLAEERGMRLAADVGANVWVLGDVMRLRQLLLVLLDNALKYTPTGGSVEVRLQQTSGGRAQLQVSDSGPGIDPVDLPRIFDRFYRADKARTGEGSGLGLAIARWIVEAHGGQLQAGNATPHGAMLTATLPVTRPVGSS